MQNSLAPKGQIMPATNWAGLARTPVIDEICGRADHQSRRANAMPNKSLAGAPPGKSDNGKSISNLSA
jgi:hypothetical protein